LTYKGFLIYFSSITLLFLFLANEFLKRGTLLLTATDMSACEFKQFLDVFLIDKAKSELSYVCCRKCSFTKSWKHSRSRAPMFIHSFTLKLHCKSMNESK